MYRENKGRGTFGVIHNKLYTRTCTPWDTYFVRVGPRGSHVSRLVDERSNTAPKEPKRVSCERAHAKCRPDK
eukprot:10087697-Karenia_brevis.AAC.1